MNDINDTYLKNNTLDVENKNIGIEKKTTNKVIK